jgi:membrane-bound lytic murein transglycosylase MltF
VPEPRRRPQLLWRPGRHGLIGGILLALTLGVALRVLPLHERPSVPTSEVPAPAPTTIVAIPRSRPDRAPAITALRPEDAPWRGDLDGMVRRRLVRMLMVPNRTDYYLDGGRPRGLVQEYAAELERRLNAKFKTGARPVRVFFIPVGRDELIPALIGGRGDIAAANLTVTPERQRVADFSAPFLRNVREIVVTGPASPPLVTLDDLAGVAIPVRRSSSYWSSLEALDAARRAKALPALTLDPMVEALEDEDLLEMLDAGLLPMAVVDEHKAKVWARALPSLQLRGNLVLRSGGEIAWALRMGSPKLRAFLDDFAEDTAVGTTFGNLVTGRYLGPTASLRNSASVDDQRRFRELEGYFRRYGELYRFDEFLLAAQGYQESGLDQSRRSPSGAVGVMQLLPRTASDPNVDIADIDMAENNIHAAAKYPRHLIDTFFADPAIAEFDRMLLALAAYNAGPAKIARLRRDTERRGLDPNHWFNNVELTVARDVGRETVQYVGNILKYYVVYQRIAAATADRKELVSTFKNP